MAVIKILSGSLTGQTLPLTAEGTLVGRHESNNLRIAEPSVSGRHAKLWLERGTWFVADQRSTNGTLVNNAEAPPNQNIALSHGDKLAFGHVLALFDALTDLAPAAPAGNDELERAKAEILQLQEAARQRDLLLAEAQQRLQGDLVPRAQMESELTTLRTALETDAAAQRDAFRREIRELEHKIVQHVAEQQALQKALGDGPVADTRMPSLSRDRAQIDELTAEKKRLEGELAAAILREQELRHAVDEGARELKEKSGIRRVAIETAEATHERVEELEQAIARLEADLATARAEAARIPGIAAEGDAARAETDKVREALARAEEAFIELRRERERDQQLLGAGEADLAALRQQGVQLREKILLLEDKLAQAEAKAAQAGSAEEALAPLRQQIAALDETLAATQRDLALARAAEEEAREAATRAESARAEHETETEDRFAAHARTIESLEAELEKAESAAAETKADLEARIATLNEQVAAGAAGAAQALADAQARNAELETEVEETKADLESKLTAAAETKADLEARIATLNEQVAAGAAGAAQALADAQARNAELETVIEETKADLESKLTAAAETKADLEARIATLNEQVAAGATGAAQALADAQARNAELEAKIAKTEESKADLDSKLAAATEAKAELEARIATLNEQVAAGATGAAQALADAQARNAELEAKIAKTEESKADLDSKLAAAAATKADLEARIATLNEQVAAGAAGAAQALADAQARNAELEAKIAKTEESKADLDSRLAAAAETKTDLEARIATLNEQVAAGASGAAQALADAQARNAELEAKVTETEESKTELEAKLAAAEASAGAAGEGAARVATLESELEGLRDEVASATRRAELRDEQMANLRSEVAAIEAERDELREKAESMPMATGAGGNEVASAERIVLRELADRVVDAVNGEVSRLRRNSEILRGYIDDCGRVATFVEEADQGALPGLAELVDEVQPRQIISQMQDVATENSDAASRAKGYLLDFKEALQGVDVEADLERAISTGLSLLNTSGSFELPVDVGGMLPLLRVEPQRAVLFGYAIAREAQAAGASPSVRLGTDGSAVQLELGPLSIDALGRWRQAVAGTGDDRARFIEGFVRESLGGSLHVEDSDAGVVVRASIPASA